MLLDGCTFVNNAGGLHGAAVYLGAGGSDALHNVSATLSNSLYLGNQGEAEA